MSLVTSLATSTNLAVVDDPSFDLHRPPESHPERPERLAAARRGAANVTARSGRFEVDARPATDDELARVHHDGYVDRLGRSAGRWAYWDADTYAAPGSVDAARRAAGGAIELVKALTTGKVSRGVALLRPPGHHAGPEGAMGFCLLNNVAIAAAHARTSGVGRVMIVDFDVHHGNGTQDVFYDDPSVLFVSLHQFPFYPGTGSRAETGGGEGRGHTVNVPLSAGAGDGAYAAAFAELVAPLAAEYAPELLLVSAGFDGHHDDPIGGMRVSAEGYRSMVTSLVRAVPATPIGMVLEGGYDLDALETSLVASLEALAGFGPAAATAFEAPAPGHLAEVKLAREAASAFWRLP
jgi:acetoin utilization deacetylase AcuC-like enzyme